MGGAESGPGTFLEASEGVSMFSLPLSKRSSSDHPEASVGRPVHGSRADGAGRDLKPHPDANVRGLRYDFGGPGTGDRHYTQRRGRPPTADPDRGREASSRPKAKTVIRQQDLQMTTEEFLREHLSVEQVPNIQWIEVHYRDVSPERAQRVANAVGDVFSKQISEVSSSANAITATVWERAVVPGEPLTPNPVRNSLLALGQH